MKRAGDEAENLGAATEALEEAAMRAPHRLEPLMNLALVYARLERTDEARDVAGEVVSRASTAQAELKQQAQKLISALGKS